METHIHSPSLVCISIICLILPHLSSAQEDPASVFITKKEDHVRAIAKLVQQVWNQSCTELPSTCLPSRLRCANDYGPGLTANCDIILYTFHFKDIACVACNHSMFNYDEGFVSVPRYTSLDDPKILQAMCRLQKLDVVFRQIMQNDTDQLPIYFGTMIGAFRIFPGGARSFVPPVPPPADRQSVSDACEAYDPRRRPWFRDAMFGRKSVVILLDVTVQMNDNYGATETSVRNIDVAKAMIHTVLNTTLRLADYVSIITFSSTATSLFPNMLYWDYRDDSQNNTVVGPVFDALAAVTIADPNDGGGAGFSRNHTAAFEAAFAAFRGNTRPQCDKKMILLISKGNDTASKPQPLLDYIASQQANFSTSQKVNILTYSLLRTDENGPLLREIACANRGVYTNIDVKVNDVRVDEAEAGMPNVLIPYYVLGGSGAVFGTSGATDVFWTEGYISATGPAQEKELTVSMPVTDLAGNYVVGVVGVDMGEAQIEANGASKKLAELAGSTKTDCRSDSFTECDIEKLRAYNDFLTNAPPSTCSALPDCQVPSFGCTVNLIADQVYAPVGAPTSYDNKSCCKGCSLQPFPLAPPPFTPFPSPPPPAPKASPGNDNKKDSKLSVGAGVGIGLGAIAVVAVLLVGLLLLYRSKWGGTKEKEQHISQDTLDEMFPDPN